MSLEDGSHLTLLVRHEHAWDNLCLLISLAQTNALKGYAALPYPALEDVGSGLIALSDCAPGAVSQALRQSDQQRAKNCWNSI